MCVEKFILCSPSISQIACSFTTASWLSYVVKYQRRGKVIVFMFLSIFVIVSIVFVVAVIASLLYCYCWPLKAIGDVVVAIIAIFIHSRYFGYYLCKNLYRYFILFSDALLYGAKVGEKVSNNNSNNNNTSNIYLHRNSNNEFSGEISQNDPSHQRQSDRCCWQNRQW